MEPGTIWQCATLYRVVVKDVVVAKTAAEVIMKVVKLNCLFIDSCKLISYDFITIVSIISFATCKISKSYSLCIKSIFAMINRTAKCCVLLPNVQVSDTTGDDSSNGAHKIK
ncbi:hypothetical protein BH11BAC6_BH11BAC6_14910 [soil metagenome]